MSKAVKPASFENFLEAPSRLSKQGAFHTKSFSRKTPTPEAKLSSAHGAARPKTSSPKVKVGLTIDERLIDAVDDYIYHARKQGHRLKKNDVYEAALRQFLEAEGIDIR